MISRKLSRSRSHSSPASATAPSTPRSRRWRIQGLVSKRTEIQDGAPNRKIYTITDAGRVAFLDSLRSPLTPEQPKSPFLMKLFFFAHLSPEERHAIADMYLKSIEELRGQLEAARPAVEAHADRFQVPVLSIRPSLFPGPVSQCL